MKGADSIHIDRDRRRACLLLHGFGGSPPDFGPLPQALDEAGWDVHIPLLPGHGTSTDELGRVSGSEVRQAVREHYREIRSRYETVALGGFSMGGCLATELAADQPPRALVLVSPFYGMTYRWYYVLPVEWWLPMASPLLDTVNAQKSVNRPKGRETIVGYGRYPLDAVNMLMALRNAIMKGLDGRTIHCPVLLVYSPSDSVASPSRSREVLERLTGGKYRAHRFPSSDHYILHDYDREPAVRCILDFLATHSGTDAEEAPR